MKSNLDKFVTQKLHILKKENILREIHDCTNIGYGGVLYQGKKLISFCSNDYLGLAQNDEIIEASIAACWEHGTGAAASRLISGNNPLYSQLEQAIAQFKGTEKSCVFGSGYLANIAITKLFAAKGDLILSDKLIHSSIHEAIQLSPAKHIRYAHNDIDSLTRQLKKHRKHYNNCVIHTETIFSMDGDIAPINQLLAIAEQYNCFLISDDAHGIGVEKYSSNNHIQIGTLSKAIGSYGGYVAASQQVIDYIKSTAKSLIYSTALPASVLAAAVTALRIIQNDNGQLAQKALNNARIFTDLMEIEPAQSCIIPIIIGDAQKSLEISQQLSEHGFMVKAIRPPTVRAKTSRLRFTFSTLHQQEDIEKLATITKNLLD